MKNKIQKEIIFIKNGLFDLNFLLDYKYCNFEDNEINSFLDKDKIRLRWNYDFINIEIRNNEKNLKILLLFLSFENIEYINELYAINKIKILLNHSKNNNIEFYFNFQIKESESFVEYLFTFGNKTYISTLTEDYVISNNEVCKDILKICADSKKDIIKEVADFFKIDKTEVNDEHFEIMYTLVI